MTEDTATSGQTAKPPRVRGRPFAPGPDPRRSLAGRPPLAVEVAHAEALRRGCPPAELERAIAKMAELAIAGNVQAASLLVRAFGLGREDTAPAVEQGESMAALLAEPGKAEAVARLMDEVFGTTATTSTPATEKGERDRG